MGTEGFRVMLRRKATVIARNIARERHGCRENVSYRGPDALKQVEG